MTVAITAPMGSFEVGQGRPLAIIAGPCGLESADVAFAVARGVKAAAARLGLPFIFKGSFDKANRTRGDAWRGPGLREGLDLLAAIRREVGVPVTTDVHESGQAEAVASVVDLLQVPAFLCRQTDLLVACGRTGKPVNVKKGQFLAPDDARYVVDKVRSAGASGVIITERGTTFGHHDLVVDFRGLADMRSDGVVVAFDATHSVQRPGAMGGRSGGTRRHVPVLARAAVAAGVDLVFAEVHPDPASALSDADTQWPLAEIDAFLGPLARLREVVS